MPDHLYIPAAGQPISRADHLRAHPLSVTLLALVTLGALGIIAPTSTIRPDSIPCWRVD